MNPRGIPERDVRAGIPAGNDDSLQRASCCVAAVAAQEIVAAQLDLCVYGLGEVRRQWEEQRGDADAPLLLG